MQWWDAVGVITGILGVLISLVGFVATLLRLGRTRHAVDAAVKRLSSNQILLLLPRLQEIERALDRAVEGGDARSVIDQLLVWRTNANQLRAMLPSRDETARLRERLATSATLASQSKGELVGGPKSTAALKRQTAGVREAIGQANELVWEYSVALSSAVAEGEGGG